MIHSHALKLIAGLLTCGALLQPLALTAEPVAVRYTEGLVHGFLVLSNLEGEVLADGDLTQVARGGRVTNRLVFHFHDGSVHDETAVFSQRRVFQLVSDHLIQKGPQFVHPVDVSIDGATGQATVLYTDDGKQKVSTAHLSAPDLSNGLVLTLLKNIPPEAGETKVSMIAVTPKPRLVKLAIASQGEESFAIGGASLKATHFVLKVEIGGVAGLVAPIVGKQPPDTHVWILNGKAPAFVKFEGPLSAGGPVWRIELASPVWPGAVPRHNESGDRKSSASSF